MCEGKAYLQDENALKLSHARDVYKHTLTIIRAYAKSVKCNAEKALQIALWLAIRQLDVKDLITARRRYPLTKPQA